MNITTLLGQMSPYYDDTYYRSSEITAAESAAVAGFAMLMFVFMMFFAVAMYVVTAIFLSRIFKKAGIEGWKAWIPVYNTWTLLELGGQKGYWAVLALIPVINIVALVFMYIAMYNIGLNFGKEGAFVLLAIFLPIVWVIWLAVDKSTWKGVPGSVTQSANKSSEPPTQAKDAS